MAIEPGITRLGVMISAHPLCRRTATTATEITLETASVQVEAAKAMGRRWEATIGIDRGAAVRTTVMGIGGSRFKMIVREEKYKFS